MIPLLMLHAAGLGRQLNMTATAKLAALIDEALRYGRVSRIGCFVSNAAAEELRAWDDSALPEIENAIRRRVVPDSGTVTDHHQLLRKHPGLLRLWITYFKVAGGGNVERVAAFLRSLDGPTLATAFLGFRAVWHNKGAGVVLPVPLLNLLREMATGGTGVAAEVARHQLQHVWAGDLENSPPESWRAST